MTNNCIVTTVSSLSMRSCKCPMSSLLTTAHKDTGKLCASRLIHYLVQCSPMAWKEMSVTILTCYSVPKSTSQYLRPSSSSFSRFYALSVHQQTYAISLSLQNFYPSSPRPGQRPCFLGIGGQLLKAISDWLK